MSRFKFSIAVTLAALLCSASAFASEKKRFDIPAQDAASALRTAAIQGDFEILIPPKLAAEKKTNAISGEFSSDTALARMLEGTGLRFRAVGDRTFVIEEGAAPAGAQGGASQNPTLLAQAQSAERREGGSTVAMEGIVVTAQKREERLVDVPISIGVVTADDINRRGLASSEDYLRGMPGVNQVATGYNSGQSIVIRGIETVPSAQNFGVGSTYASYFGETPTTNTAGVSGGTSVDIKVVDVERVEVLRGPQGTAFGDSSLGGAVRIIPVAPKLNVFEGRAAGEYSRTSGYGGDNYNAQGVLNIPLLQDRLAVRAVAYEYTESGYYRNVAGSDPTFQAGPVTQYGAQAFAVNKDKVGSTYVRGGRFAALFRVNNDLKLSLNFLSQRNDQDGIPLANSGRFEQALFQVDPQQAVRGQAWGYSDQHINVVNPVLEWKLGWADFVATYSRTRSGSGNAEPFGLFGSNLALSQGQPSDHKERVGEVRLVTHFDGPLNFLVGAFAEKLEDSAVITFYWFGSGATDPFTAGFRGNVGTALINRELKQKAVYGEANWEIIPRITLTAGARYYDYDRTFFDVRSGPVVGNSNFAGNVSATGVNPRFNASYRFGNDALVYAAYSEGFRLGTPQPKLPASRCDTNGDGVIDGTNTTIDSTGVLTSDKIKNYEAGIKGTWLNSLSLEAAVFHMLWSGVPVRVLAPAPCLLSYQANAGNAQSDGIEFNAFYRIARDWRASIGASWAHARLTNDVPALKAKAGNHLPGAPKFNANAGLQYDFLVYGHKSFMRADAIYVGKTYGDLLESPSITSGAYTKIDLTAGTAAGAFDLNVFVRNLTNADEFVFRGTNAAVPALYGYRLRPRTIGLRVGYRF